MIFVEFAEELTQKSQYSFQWRHGHRKVYYLVNSYCNSSTGLNRQAVHILPQRCLLDLHPNLQQRKVICPYFHVLISRKSTVPAGKQNNNSKDPWIRFCSRSFGGRPVTVPGWRSTHSKESMTSAAKTTAFFLLCTR